MSTDPSVDAPGPAGPSGVQGVGSAAAGGMRAFAFTVVLEKLGGLTLQLLLGWVLVPADFAAYAVAMAFGSVALAIRDGSVVRVALRENVGRHVDRRALTRRIASSTAVLTVTLAVIGTVLTGYLFDADSVTGVLLSICGVILLSIPSAVYQVELGAGLEFRRAASVRRFGSAARQLGTAAFAVIGLGPYSFVAGMAAGVIVDNIAGWAACRVSSAKSVRRQSSERCENESLAAWPTLAALGIVLTTQGDYVALGLMATATVTGTYYFAFQLTVGVSSLFSTGIVNVMMPAFKTAHVSDALAQRALANAASALAYVSCPLCFVAALGTPAAVQTLWSGRWDDAALPAAMLFASLPARLFTPLVQAYLQALGRWRTAASIALTDGVATVTVMAAWATSGNLTLIAIGISMYRLMMGYGQLYVALHIAKGSRLIVSVVKNFVIAGLPAVLLAILCWRVAPLSSAHASLLAVALYCVGAAACIFGPGRGRLVRIISLLRGR